MGQGDVRSRFYLGCLHYEGKGVRKDRQEGQRLLRLAADQKDDERVQWLHKLESQQESSCAVL